MCPLPTHLAWEKTQGSALIVLLIFPCGVTVSEIQAEKGYDFSFSLHVGNPASVAALTVGQSIL